MYKSKTLKIIAVQRFFRFAEPMFLLLDVCNNDSYVIRAMLWRKSLLLKTKA